MIARAEPRTSVEVFDVIGGRSICHLAFTIRATVQFEALVVSAKMLQLRDIAAWPDR